MSHIDMCIACIFKYYYIQCYSKCNVTYSYSDNGCAPSFLRSIGIHKNANLVKDQAVAQKGKGLVIALSIAQKCTQQNYSISHYTAL